MSHRLLLFALFVFALTPPVSAQAFQYPASVFIDGIHQDLAWDTDGSELTSQVSQSGASFSISASPSAGPTIGYTMLVTDLGAPSTFQFIYAFPITPLLSPVIVRSSLQGTHVDAQEDGFALTALGPSGLVGSYELNDENLGIDIGPGFSVPGDPNAPALFGDPPGSYGPFGASALYDGGTHPYSTMGMSIYFGLSGNGDQMFLNGNFTVSPIPEPASGTLLILGIGAVAAIRRRKRDDLG